MFQLTVTSTFASSLVVGDPGIITFVLAPKETKVVEMSDSQLRQLAGQLEKLVAAGWLRFTVAERAAPIFNSAPVVAPEPVAPVAPQEPVEVPEPVTPPAPVVPPEAPVPEPEPIVPPEAPVETPAAATEGVASAEAVPSAPKVQFFGKGRNR